MAYSDSAAVMLLSEAAVKDLSSRLDKDVTVSRFHPNIVVSDCEAFGEVWHTVYNENDTSCNILPIKCLMLLIV